MNQSRLIADTLRPARALCPISSDTGLQTLDVRPDLSLTLLDCSPDRPLRIRHDADAFAQHLIVVLQGEIELEDSACDAGSTAAALAGGRLYRLRTRGDGLYLSIAAGEPVRAVLVHVTGPTLLRLLPEDGTTRSNLIMDSRAAGAACLRTAMSLFGKGGEAPPLRGLMLEARALELLALALTDLAQPAAEAGGLTRREHAQVSAARDRLLANLVKPPSLRQLAEAVGLNEKRLNEGFRALFGVTVFECLRNARLEKAKALLFQEDLPLKAIAWQVGYSHVNNFITAYRNRFGEPPRRHVNGPSQG